MLRILLLLAMTQMPALAAGFTVSLGARLAAEPSADLRINYEAELESGMVVGLNTRFRLRGLDNGAGAKWPGNLYLSGDVQASPFIQFTQRIPMEGWRLEPYQRLELTAGSYLFAQQSPVGAYVSVAAVVGAKFRFSLDRATRFSNDLNLGLDGWDLIPSKPLGDALVIADELRLDWNLGGIEPYVRAGVGLYPLHSEATKRLILTAIGGLNFNLSSDLEAQLEAGFKTPDAYLQTRLTFRLP
jgi:hypothetical protein